MIDGEQMGTILRPLEERFKKFSNQDQARVYLSRLKHLDAEALKKAVDHLVDYAKAFPTPGEIKTAYRETSKGTITPQVEGCSSCIHGWVYYTRPVFGQQYVHDGWIGEFAAPCALCIPEHSIPMVIAKETGIFRVARNIGRDSPWYVADLNHPEEIEGAFLGNRYIRERAVREGKIPA